MADLKPCPFCGSDKLKIDSKSGRIHYYEKDGMKSWQNVVYSIRCNCCHARGGAVSSDLPTSGAIGIYEKKREEVMNRAVKAWNTRKPEEAAVAAIKEKHCKKCRNILGIAGAEEYCKDIECEIEGVCEIVRNSGKE